MKPFFLFILLAGVAFLATGCATRMIITSEPEGAMVRLRGEGRAAFRWKTGPSATPCEMDVYYGRVSVYVIWPDGEEKAPGRLRGVVSERQTRDLSLWHRTEAVHFVKP